MADAAETVVRAYYRALDDHDYDRLADLLAPDVVQHRPDRTFEGREAFVGFMRDDRPDKETTHDVRAVYASDGADELAARGRLLDSTGDPLAAFVDVFSFENGRIVEIDTYTR